jgi:hypothetical protein
VLQGRVTSVRNKPMYSELHVNAGPALMVRDGVGSKIAPGADVCLRIAPEAVKIFPTN